MKKITIIIFLLFAGFTNAQEKGIIEGIVLDNHQIDEPLAFVNISLKKTSVKTATNIDGAYAIEVDPGMYTLVFNFPGYDSIETSNVIVKAGEITSIKKIALAARELMLSEATVTPKK